jgi:hypothetical protein
LLPAKSVFKLYLATIALPAGDCEGKKLTKIRDSRFMGIRELLIVIAIVAVVVMATSGWASKETAPVPVATRSPTTPQTPTWSVNGAKATDSTDSLIEKFGAPVKDTTDEDVRFTILKTPSGEIRRTEFLADRTAGVSGTILERDGEVVVAEGDTLDQVKERLGEPILIRNPDDTVSYQYDGARIYFRNDIVFGVVIEAAQP